MRLWAALLLAAACARPAAAAPRARRGAGGTMTVESKDARFRCAAPKWDKIADAAQDAGDKVYAVTLREPGAAAGPAAQITIEWYAPGNALFAAADDYVAVNASTQSAVAGASASPVARVKVAGLPARRWTERTFAVSTPNAVRASRVELRSERVVVEAPQGFYALSLTAPSSVFDSKRAAFQRVLDTFAPRP